MPPVWTGLSNYALVNTAIWSCHVTFAMRTDVLHNVIRRVLSIGGRDVRDIGAVSRAESPLESADGLAARDHALIMKHSRSEHGYSVPDVSTALATAETSTLNNGASEL